MDKVKEFESKLDQELSKHNYFVTLEKKTGLKKTHLVAGAVSALIFMTALNIGAPLIVNLVGFVYPMWASMVALKTASKTDDSQWLAYWIVYGFLSIVDYFDSIILQYIPLYYLFKLAIVLYLALPQFRGAEVFYTKFLKDLPVEKYGQTAATKVNSIAKEANTIASNIVSQAKEKSGKAE